MPLTVLVIIVLFVAVCSLMYELKLLSKQKVVVLVKFSDNKELFTLDFKPFTWRTFNSMVEADLFINSYRGKEYTFAKIRTTNIVFEHN